uniref:G-protein coupled receptors family 1 profile domain-containing protein n=1 Tax=Mustela putorius furo TaxID=9669 RepID=M3YXL4_MUSPF
FMEWENKTFNSEFILLIFSNSPTHIFLFSLVLIILIGKTFMFLLIYLVPNQMFHMDLMLICTTVPKTAFNCFSDRKSISLAGCGAQIFFYESLLGEESFLLAAMAYDHYVAICNQLMNQKMCCILVVSSLIVGFLDGINVNTVALFFPYCGAREIPHFFYDVSVPLALSCTNTLLLERLMLICCVIIILFPEAVTNCFLCSCYCGYNSHGVWRGSPKIFATSSSLMVVGMYDGAPIFIYMWLVSDHSPIRTRWCKPLYHPYSYAESPHYSPYKKVARAFMKVLGKNKS